MAIDSDGDCNFLVQTPLGQPHDEDLVEVRIVWNDMESPIGFESQIRYGSHFFNKWAAVPTNSINYQLFFVSNTDNPTLKIKWECWTDFKGEL